MLTEKRGMFYIVTAYYTDSYTGEEFTDEFLYKNYNAAIKGAEELRRESDVNSVEISEDKEARTVYTTKPESVEKEDEFYKKIEKEIEKLEKLKREEEKRI